MTETVLDGVIECLHSALDHNVNTQVAPVALLWPDEQKQWVSAIPRLSERVPIVVLGDNAAVINRGPAYWIRCVVARTIEFDSPSGVPIVYLPGVARSSLRAVDSCPPYLAPIAELQYRSQWFSHPNGRDWTIVSLLSHQERGLGLNLTSDPETAAAARLAVAPLVGQRIDTLSRHLLDADFFHELVSPDPVRSLLGWLDDPTGFHTNLGEAQWSAFVLQCKADYGFNPEFDGEVTAARKLGERHGSWQLAWERFAEMPHRYPNIPDQLRKARPAEQLALGEATHSESWPQDNDESEYRLRRVLRDFEALTTEGARKQIADLEEHHAWRRGTVWAELDRAPLAFAVEQLAVLAELTSQPLADHDLLALTADYSERGWKADDALLHALAAVTSAPDQDAVGAAATAIYRPWLDTAARAMQALTSAPTQGNNYVAGPPAARANGVVTLFVDGLRLDVAHRVSDRLANAGMNVEVATSLAALPTVTQTSKPALMPIAPGFLTGGPELHAQRSSTGTRAQIAVLRTLMGENDVQVLGPTGTGQPGGAAWAEVGEVDSRGHEMGAGLAHYIDQEVERIAVRVRGLLEAGWEQVNVVTDHGWILLPVALEKVNLPPAPTLIKKGRCARLKEGAVVDTPTVPWFWDKDVRIAVAPGASCFEAGKEYEHGGISPQECIVPRLTVTAGSSSPAHGVEISKIKWLRMLCRIELSGPTSDLSVDLRALPADPTTSIAEQAKETSTVGKVSLMVPDEELEGERAHLVVVSPEGQILAQREVVVGRNR